MLCHYISKGLISLLMLQSHWLDTNLPCFVTVPQFDSADSFQTHKRSVSLLRYNVRGAFFCVLQENGSSEEHVLYVWDHFVSKAAAKNVFIMAHSYGGLSFVELVSVLLFRLSFLPPTNKKTHCALLSAQSLT